MKKLSRQVELMDLDSANIGVAEYRTHIPNMKLLQKHLHRAIELAGERSDSGELPHQAGTENEPSGTH